MSEEPLSLVVVYAGSAMEAGRVQSLLESEGIRASLDGENVAAVEAGVVGAGGMGLAKVLVARNDVDAAKKIIEGVTGTGD
jgi:hypothetical protein